MQINLHICPLVCTLTIEIIEEIKQKKREGEKRKKRRLCHSNGVLVLVLVQFSTFSDRLSANRPTFFSVAMQFERVHTTVLCLVPANRLPTQCQFYWVNRNFDGRTESECASIFRISMKLETYEHVCVSIGVGVSVGVRVACACMCARLT